VFFECVQDKINPGGTTMLSKEQAEKALKAAELPEGEGPKRLALRVAQLPEPVRTLALTVMQRDEHGNAMNHNWQKINQARTQFTKLEAGLQDALMDAWFPQFVPLVRAAARRSRPYLGSYQARPFRLPDAGPNAPLDETGFFWLERLRSLTENRDQPLHWYVEHAAYLGYGSDEFAPLFAAAIDAGDSHVLEVLIASGKNEHPIGMMGDHVPTALLMASQPKGWEFIEKLLLAAQRQEGLRQSIFTAMLKAHPTAFKRMLHLILDHDLIRFSSSVQALQNMMGWEDIEAKPKQLRDGLEALLGWLEDIPACLEHAANTKSEPEPLTLFQWLWCIANQDANQAARLAAAWLKHKNETLRFTAAAFLVCLSNQALTQEHLLVALEDPELRVVARAFQSNNFGADGTVFETFERLLTRVPKEMTFASPVLWLAGVKISPSEIAGGMYRALGERDPKRLLPYWNHLDTWTRSNVLDRITERKSWDASTRALVLQSVGDSGEYVRRSAFNALHKHDVKLESDEVRGLEGLLTRKRSDLRQGIIKLLLRQPKETAQDSAERLSGAKHAEQRAAGDELKRALEAQEGQADAPTLHDGLGLFDPLQRTKPQAPKAKKVQLVTLATLECLKALDALIEQHAQTPAKFKNWAGEQQEAPLINAYFYEPDRSKPLDEATQLLPLREVWETWYANRPKTQRDPDGLELLRAGPLMTVLGPQVHTWRTEYRPKAIQNVLDELIGVKTKLLEKLINKKKQLEFKHPRYIQVVLAWLTALHPPDGATDFLLDAAEHALAHIIPALETLHATLPPEPQTKHDDDIDLDGFDLDDIGDDEDDEDELDAASKDRVFLNNWTSDDRLSAWLFDATPWIPGATDAQATRWWHLHRAAFNTPGRSMREFPALELTLRAWKAGKVSDVDVLDQLIGTRNLNPQVFDQGNFNELYELSVRKPDTKYAAFQELKALVNRVRDRIIEVERLRGDLPTAASKPAMNIRHVEGTEKLVSLLTGLGKTDFVRGYISRWGELSRSDTISHLIRVTFPAPTDTPEGFARLVKDAGISEKRLVELGLYAPQWSRFVEYALSWEGAAQAMWWLHAHTKDRGWHIDDEVLEGWQSEIAEQTPLTAQDLLDGAVDVAWFKRVHAALGVERWAKVYEAAKFASGGTGHTRARQFADAMLGQLEVLDVIERIRSKRHQDSVRALGLIPLPDSSHQDDLDAAVLKRFEVIQEFLRGSKAFGSQRRESEGLAARIGLMNLANTAGYPDPLRLTWAMELKGVEDLSNGPVTLERDGTQFKLEVTEAGEAVLSIAKNGKPLKAVPVALKKNEDVLAFQERRRELGRQGLRMRVSLERAMVHGDAFRTKELKTPWAHPILRAMFTKLVFVTDAGKLGYLTRYGQVLRDHAGQETKLGARDSLRIAHPVDLLATKAWSAWQHECFESSRVQPFKQVFRELYVLTQAERTDKVFSSRYAGHQVNAKQSMALLGQRGWVSRMDEGLSRTFHDESITAWLESNQGWTTPAEVEAPKLENLYFTRKGDWKRLELTSVPPRLLSEVMRDIDLIVSVAHVGGVDPEASQSTVEMRAAMVHETSRLLKLENVQIKDSHVLVQGQLNRYTVHLGSGTVHQQPGGYLCIVAVPSQQRGRVFLPFADNDPRTIEVVSKVMLLARDAQIQDPSILRQIV
jgi:hypothetical protein